MAGTTALPGSAMGTIRQVLPFHLSANSLPEPAPPVPVSPMARQADRLAQDTARSSLAAAPRGTRGNPRCHDAPSQCPASGRLIPSAGMYQPTATQDRLVRQDTPRNWSAGVLACAACGALTAAVAAGAVTAAATGAASRTPEAAPASQRWRGTRLIWTNILIAGRITRVPPCHSRRGEERPARAGR